MRIVDPCIHKTDDYACTCKTQHRLCLYLEDSCAFQRHSGEGREQLRHRIIGDIPELIGRKKPPFVKNEENWAFSSKEF